MHKVSEGDCLVCYENIKNSTHTKTTFVHGNKQQIINNCCGKFINTEYDTMHYFDIE